MARQDSKSSPASVPGPLFVGSLEKGFRVLHAFGEINADLGTTEIAKETGLDKSAAQRFANTLHKLGYLDKDPVTRRYRPARRLMELSFAYLRHSDLAAAAMPRLIAAGGVYNTTVNLAEPLGLDMIYAIRIPHQSAAYVATVPGRRVPMYCTATGLAYLSCLPQAEAESIVERSTRSKISPKTMTDPDKIMTEIARARKRGVAVTSGQLLEREISVAAPVLDVRGNPIAAVHLPTYTPAWSVAESRKKLAPLAIETADAISGALIAADRERSA